MDQSPVKVFVFAVARRSAPLLLGERRTGIAAAAGVRQHLARPRRLADVARRRALGPLAPLADDAVPRSTLRGGYGPFSIAWPSCPCFVRSFLFLFSKKKPFHAKTLVFLHNVSLESNRLIKVCVCVCVCENGALRHGGQRPDKNLPSICFLLDFVFGSAITNDIHHGGVILHFDQGIGIQV